MDAWLDRWKQIEQRYKRYIQFKGCFILFDSVFVFLGFFLDAKKLANLFFLRIQFILFYTRKTSKHKTQKIDIKMC